MNRTAMLIGLAILSAVLPAQAAETTTVSFFIEAPGDAISITHGNQVAIAPFPAGIPLMTDAAISDTLLLTAKIRDASGKVVGISSELEYFPEVPVSLTSIWDTYWTLVIPNRGTLYAYHQEQLGEEAYEAFKAAAESGQVWEGEYTKKATVGPLADKHGQIVGGTGEFAGAKGRFEEIGTLTKVAADGTLHASIELRFTFE